jgi:hypothetical protein
MAKASKIRATAAARGQPVRELLIDLYRVHGSQQAVAAALEVSPATISTHLKIEGLREFTIAVTQEKAS